jgi:hypothetical protein
MELLLNKSLVLEGLVVAAVVSVGARDKASSDSSDSEV